MQGTLHPVFSSRQPLLHTTAKPVTPFGGLVSLIEFFNSLKLGEVLGRLMPLVYQGPNTIPPEQTLLALVISIIVGARRSAARCSSAADIRKARSVATTHRVQEGTRVIRRLDAHNSSASFRLQLHGCSARRRVRCWPSTHRSAWLHLHDRCSAPPHGAHLLRRQPAVGCLARLNLLSLYQQAVGSREEKHYQRPATLRSSVFIGGAILGRRGRQPVLHIAQSWGGAEKQKPLMDKLLEWQKRTSLKLEPPAALPPENSLKNAA